MMLSNSIRRPFTPYSGSTTTQLRLLSTCWIPRTAPPNSHENDHGPRRSIHRSCAVRQADAGAVTTAATTATKATAPTSSLLKRFIVTAEVTVSKIMPAGFGWQSASLLASSMGYASDSTSFALTTGAGDAVGVLAGHCLYYGIKKAVYDEKINMTRELQTDFCWVLPL